MKIEETQRQKDKKSKLSKFNIDKVDDFIADKNRKRFGHMCDSCSKKRWCDKAKNAIILKCKEFAQKQYQQNQNDNYKRRRRWA